MTAAPHESGAIGGDYWLGLVCPHALKGPHDMHSLSHRTRERERARTPIAPTRLASARAVTRGQAADALQAPPEGDWRSLAARLPRGSRCGGECGSRRERQQTAQMLHDTPMLSTASGGSAGREARASEERRRAAIGNKEQEAARVLHRVNLAVSRAAERVPPYSVNELP